MWSTFNLSFSFSFFLENFITNFLRFHNDTIWCVACFNCDTGHSATLFNVLFLYDFLYIFLPSICLFSLYEILNFLDYIISFVPWFLSPCFGLLTLAFMWLLLFLLYFLGNFLYYFARVTITKFHRMGVLTTEIYFVTILEAGSPRSSCQWSWFPLGPLSMACRQQPSSCLFTWSSFQACPPCWLCAV